MVGKKSNMGTLKLNQLEPSLDFKFIREQAELLDNYFSLYWYHLQGNPLPLDFPQELILQYPDLGHIPALVSTIEKQMRAVNSLLEAQGDSLKNYSKLYLLYTSGQNSDEIPKEITKEFPKDSCQTKLKNKISTLNQEIEYVKSLLRLC